jgi:hypothetical protein
LFIKCRNGTDDGEVAKIFVSGDDIYLGVNYRVKTDTGVQGRFSITKILFTDETIDIYAKTGTIPSTTVIDTSAGNAELNGLKICNGALIVVGTYLAPPVINGQSPAPANGTRTGFLYSTNVISTTGTPRTFFSSWAESFVKHIICENFAQQITVFGDVGPRGLFVSSVNAITGAVKYVDQYYDVTLSAVTESNDWVYVFGQFYADIWNLKYSQVANPTFMIQLNKDLLPSQA